VQERKDEVIIVCVVKICLCQRCDSLWGSRDIASFIFNLCIRWNYLHAFAALVFGKRPRYPLNRKLQTVTNSPYGKTLAVKHLGYLVDGGRMTQV